MTTTTWHEFLRHFDHWMQAAGRPTTTRDLRRYQLRAIARDLPDPHRITNDDLTEWMADHPAWTAETRRSYRSAARVFFRWAVTTGRLDHDPAAALPAIRAPRHHARPTPDDVWRPALAGGDPRVHLMIMLGARLGLRRGEIARVRGADLVPDLTGTSLRVQGKGDRVRIVPLPGDVAGILRHYVRTVAGQGWLFPSPAGGHLTPAHVGKLVSGALGPGWTTHTLRHRFATSVYSSTRDVFTVQDLLGHAKSDTTRGYVELPDDARRSAVAAAA